jgi:excisionase family DNA binding protein
VNRLLTAREAAEYTRYSVNTILNAARIGELRGQQRAVGASWRFREPDLDHWMQGK